MSSYRLPSFLTGLLLLAACSSCSLRAIQNLVPAREPGNSNPQVLAPPAAPAAPDYDKAQTIPPTTTFALSSADFNLILGRPTADSIAFSFYSQKPAQLSIAYGTAPGIYTFHTGMLELKAGIPLTTELTGLAANTGYYYQLVSNSLATQEHHFYTQRSPDNSFSFTLDADPHNRDPRFSGELYATTLGNALAEQPDFHINLGDSFMTEKLKPTTYAEALSTFTDLRPYFGIIGPDVPLFLVNGNHEGELGWLLPRGNNRDLPIWSTQLRQLYYPSPTPGAFYHGATQSEPTLGSPRDAYYAWTWGDALFVVLDPFWYSLDKPKSGSMEDNWNWTLGKDQYDWLNTTLEDSPARFKFIFIHHLVGGSKEARGGIEFANLFEWGGNNADGSYGFETQRPGWGKPIHQILVENKVSAVFHGHDHIFVKQEIDGIVYQECPQPSNLNASNTRIAAEYGYTKGDILPGSGHLRIIVSQDQTTVQYIQALLPQNGMPDPQNGQSVFSYTIR